MQMIIHYAVQNYTAFRQAFDNDAEDRGNNGLSLLQLWREDDASAWALFQVNDPKAATGYLQGAAQVFNSQAGVTGSQWHLVETV